MTADQRAELLKLVMKDDRTGKLSFKECGKIAKDLNLTLEQVKISSFVLWVFIFFGFWRQMNINCLYKMITACIIYYSYILPPFLCAYCYTLC